MNSLVQNFFLTIFILGSVFMGFLYYLGATDPRVSPAGEFAEEEVLINGQWVTYRQEREDGDPGEIFIYDDGPHANPVFIAGEARSNWFSEAGALAQVIAADGSLLWEGQARTDERYVYDLIVPFITEADVGDYEGVATFIMYPGDESDEPDREHSFTQPISIVDNDILYLD